MCAVYAYFLCGALYKRCNIYCTTTSCTSYSVSECDCFAVVYTALYFTVHCVFVLPHGMTFCCEDVVCFLLVCIILRVRTTASRDRGIIMLSIHCVDRAVSLYSVRSYAINISITLLCSRTQDAPLNDVYARFPCLDTVRTCVDDCLCYCLLWCDIPVTVYHTPRNCTSTTTTVGEDVVTI